MARNTAPGIFDPEITTEEGILTTTDRQGRAILALGGRLTTDLLLMAYRAGVFPWPLADPSDADTMVTAWFCPPERGVLFFEELCTPPRLRRRLKALKKAQGLRVSIDEAFSKVVAQCSLTPRPGQSGTWITAEIQQAYTELHQRGYAHSVEVWQSSKEQEALVGGIYGVSIDGAFAGESMFYTHPDASKLALLTLIEHLSSKGLTWMDIQVMTPHMKALGARLISRREFLSLLIATHRQNLCLF